MVCVLGSFVVDPVVACVEEGAAVGLHDSVFVKELKLRSRRLFYQ